MAAHAWWFHPNGKHAYCERCGVSVVAVVEMQRVGSHARPKARLRLEQCGGYVPRSKIPCCRPPKQRW